MSTKGIPVCYYARIWEEMENNYKLSNYSLFLIPSNQNEYHGQYMLKECKAKKVTVGLWELHEEDRDKN